MATEDRESQGVRTHRRSEVVCVSLKSKETEGSPVLGVKVVERVNHWPCGD